VQLLLVLLIYLFSIMWRFVVPAISKSQDSWMDPCVYVALFLGYDRNHGQCSCVHVKPRDVSKSSKRSFGVFESTYLVHPLTEEKSFS
jgi:hypothetical protein